tara:strand:- start:8 stop:169 length:162 start_codon:yes stop_codon:yes gene_type:complete
MANNPKPMIKRNGIKSLLTGIIAIIIWVELFLELLSTRRVVFSIRKDVTKLQA